MSRIGKVGVWFAALWFGACFGGPEDQELDDPSWSTPEPGCQFDESGCGGEPRRAAVLAEVEITEACCFDFDGDGEEDNQLFRALALETVGFTFARQESDINKAIDKGMLVYLLGLLDAGTPNMRLEYTLGEGEQAHAPDPAGGNVYVRSPLDADREVWAPSPTPAQIDGQLLRSESGSGGVYIFLFSDVVPLLVKAEALRVEATVATNEEDGVSLVDGKLGGTARVTDLYTSINRFFDETCSCASGVPPGGSLIMIDEEEPLKFGRTRCREAVDLSSCGQETPDVQSACETVIEFCSTVVQFAPGVADVASEHEGESCGADEIHDCDAISFGFEFTAHGAKINE